MDETQVRQIIRDELSGLLKSDRYLFEKLIQIAEGRNIQTGTTTGTKFPNSSTQKWGAFGVTPVAQQDAISSPTADVNSLKTAVDAIRTALINLGLTG